MARFEKLTRAAVEVAKRSFSSSAAATTPGSRKVAVVGAGGGIGQPLSLLMKVRTASSPVSIYQAS